MPFWKKHDCYWLGTQIQGSKWEKLRQALGSYIIATFKIWKYDVIHFHAEGPCATMWIPKLMGKRCIATVHGLDHKRQKWSRFASAYIMMGEKTAVKYADEIIVLSRNVQKYFLDRYGRKTIYIPNGVNRPVITEPHNIKKKFGIGKDWFLKRE